MTGKRTNSGKALNNKWKIGAAQARYHKDGDWYMPLEYFPGVLCDPNGYILFRTEEEYLDSDYLEIGERVHVRGGISRIPGYKKMQ